MQELQFEVGAVPPDLESGLGRLEMRLAEAERSLKTAAQELRRAREACRVGNLRDLPKTLAAAASAAQTHAACAGDMAGSWSLGASDHLASGRYLAEVADAAAGAGVKGVREVDGKLYSFPYIVRVEPRELTVRIGKRRHRGLRPSHLAQLLKAAQSKPAKDNLGSVLHAVERAYLALVQRELGKAIPLVEIHALLTLMPGAGRDYTLDDLVMDMYRLDLDGPHLTRSGLRMDLPASTSARGGKGIRFVTRDGEEKLYSTVRFQAVAR
ncbi:MAG TPA: hypothetical protein VMW47_11630 [Verrucomicrobiae bacterium]|nr:hypothetical protein [Verrucomicrobiae bacterium]